MQLKSLKIFSLLLLFVFTAKAQRYNMVIGPEISIPSGNSSNRSAIGYGGYLKGEIGLNEKFSLTGSGAVVSFLGKRFFGQRQPTLSYAPVKAGLKYYTESNFYFEGQVGASFPLNAGRKATFAWSPGAGTFIKSRNTGNQLDFGLRYEGWTHDSTFSFFSLRVGYSFNL